MVMVTARGIAPSDRAPCLGSVGLGILLVALRKEPRRRSDLLQPAARARAAGVVPGRAGGIHRPCRCRG
jgi:hypothetical protein